jgi:hypothetical protein
LKKVFWATQPQVGQFARIVLTAGRVNVETHIVSEPSTLSSSVNVKSFIRSVSIREPGRIKGVRLFHLDSILAFIERCEKEAKSDLDVI